MDFLNYTDWQDTADTLHMLLQMSGKVKLLYRAKRPEWAHIRQYLTLDGISTGIVPEAPVPFEINFDFREDQVVFRKNRKGGLGGREECRRLLPAVYGGIETNRCAGQNRCELTGIL